MTLHVLNALDLWLLTDALPPLRGHFDPSGGIMWKDRELHIPMKLLGTFVCLAKVGVALIANGIQVKSHGFPT